MKWLIVFQLRAAFVAFGLMLATLIPGVAFSGKVFSIWILTAALMLAYRFAKEVIWHACGITEKTTLNLVLNIAIGLVFYLVTAAVLALFALLYPQLLATAGVFQIMLAAAAVYACTWVPVSLLTLYSPLRRLLK